MKSGRMKAWKQKKGKAWDAEKHEKQKKQKAWKVEKAGKTGSAFWLNNVLAVRFKIDMRTFLQVEYQDGINNCHYPSSPKSMKTQHKYKHVIFNS